MMASFCVSSGNVGLCVRTLKGKTIGRETGRDGSSMQHHLFTLNLDEWWWILSPPLSLKGSDVLFYHSKQVFILEGASDNEMQLFHCSDRGTMSLRAFYQSDKGTRSWWLARCIHRNNGNYSYTFEYIFLWLWYSEILPLCNWDFTILDHFEKETKGTKKLWTQNCCHGNLSELQVHLALSSTVTPWSRPGKVGPGQNPHQQGHLQSQP